MILVVHIVTAFIWIGSMIGYVLSSYPSIKQIPNEKLMVRTSIRTLRRLTNLIITVSIALLVSGVVITIGESYSEQDPFHSTIISTKELLWVFMFVNTIVIYKKVIQSKKRCMASDSAGARDNVRFISNYLIILNIFLGLIALYFGMMLRD